jgi:predicted lipid-binding transport protein (Tim44 family)
VAHRFQIVLSRASRPEQPGSPSLVPGPLGRLKLIVVGILLAGLAVGVLVFVLLLGSIVAAILWVLLVIGTVVVILKTTLRRTRQ